MTPLACSQGLRSSLHHHLLSTPTAVPGAPGVPVGAVDAKEDRHVGAVDTEEDRQLPPLSLSVLRCSLSLFSA